MKTSLITLFFIGLLLTFVCENGVAQIASSSPMISAGMTAEEIALRNKARRKMYPGGMDEEPLKVQAQLPVLKSKYVSEDDEPPMPDDAD